MGSNGRGCESCSSAKRTHGAEGSLPSIGPTCHVTRTFVRSTRPHGPIDSPLNDERWEESGTHPTLTADATTQNVLISSLEVPRAKTSALPANERASMAKSLDSSLSLLASQMSLYGQEDGSSLRTSPACSLPSVEVISRSFSVHWATSGFTTSPGECWTAVTSECPSGGDASSLLRDVLLERVPERFYLSPKAAAGILHRATRRGRGLPSILRAALSALASAIPTALELLAADAASMETTSTAVGDSQLAFMLPKTPLASTREPQRSDVDPISASVRRLTPTECERLQAFPDGWTIPDQMGRDITQWGMR